MRWVLVDGRLTVEEGRAYATALLNSCDAAAELPRIPVLHTGVVHEILPIAESVGLDPRLTITPLSRLKSYWLMFQRVFWTWRRISLTQRLQSGLTLLRFLTDLPAAYRIASLFRGIPYTQWVQEVDTLSDRDRSAIKTKIANWINPPNFRVMVLGSPDDALRSKTLQLLERQIYRHYALADEMDISSDDWWIFLQPGDVLAEHALYYFASVIQQKPEASFIYSDDDELDGGVRCRPRFKPDWSLIHLQATNYIGSAAVFNGHDLLNAGLTRPWDDLWGMMQRLGAEAEDRVHHIPAVLMHRDAVTVRKCPPVFKRLRFHSVGLLPMVSIIIPTRDAGNLLRQCVESVMEKTSYQRYEILLADNGTTDSSARSYLEKIARHPRIRWLRDLRPFNYSELNNAAVLRAQGEVVCLLNNDTEIISRDWLEEMVGHLIQPKVGVVGAKLYYPDGRVQHGGDVVGVGGCANHLHAFIGRDEAGYCSRAVVAQELSAVTAACMVTWRSLYLKLGGFEEKCLPVAFNDVDYCLRVRKSGYKVVWTPHAELYHHESVSRGKDHSQKRQTQAKKEVRYMRRTWWKEMQNDPFYNPNFSFARPDFVLGPAPRIKRPWL